MKLLLTISLTLMLPAIAVGQSANFTRAQIKKAEEQLSHLGYWTGPIDGVFDVGSQSALIAFQKWQGREATGQLLMNWKRFARARCQAPEKSDTSMSKSISIVRC